MRSAGVWPAETVRHSSVERGLVYPRGTRERPSSTGTMPGANHGYTGRPGRPGKAVRSTLPPSPSTAPRIPAPTDAANVNTMNSSGVMRFHAAEPDGAPPIHSAPFGACHPLTYGRPNVVGRLPSAFQSAIVGRLNIVAGCRPPFNPQFSIRDPLFNPQSAIRFSIYNPQFAILNPQSFISACLRPPPGTSALPAPGWPLRG